MKRNLKSILAASAAIAAIAGASPAFAQAEPAAAAETEAQTEDQRLAVYFDEIFQRNVANSPIFQAQLGMKGDAYGEWDDFSDAETVRQFEETKADLARLRSDFDYDALSEQSKISYRIFEFLQERAIKGHPYRFHGYAFSTMNNPATFPATFLQNLHRVDNLDDAEAYISRINAITGPFGDLMEGIDMAAKRGIVPTSYSFDPVITDAGAMLKGAPFDDSGADSAIFADFKGKVDALEIEQTEKDRLVAEARAALLGPFKDSIEGFITKVESVRKKSPGPNGVWKLPKGKEFYKNQVEFWTSEKDLTADEIHEIGLADVKRIRGEMETIMQEVGFDGGRDPRNRPRRRRAHPR